MRVHVLLHGWLSHKPFQKRMAPWIKLAADLGDVCCFPRAPSWSQSWGERDGAWLAAWLGQRIPRCDLVLIGHSDGATWVHNYALAIAKHLPQHRIWGIVHYAGLFYPDSPRFDLHNGRNVFVYGQDDWVTGICHSPARDTIEAAKAYGVKPIAGYGGHRWDHRNTPEIVRRLQLAGVRESCLECDGTGRSRGGECPMCQGTGWLRTDG